MLYSRNHNPDPPKRSLIPSYSQPSFPHKAQAFTNLLFITINLPFLDIHINRTQHIVFCIQLLQLEVKSCSRVQLFVTPRTAAHQAPPSMRFSRQEHEWVPASQLGTMIFKLLPRRSTWFMVLMLSSLPPCGRTTDFLHSQVDDHFTCFHVLRIMNKTTLSICVHVFMQTGFYFFGGEQIGVELLGQMVALYFVFKETFQLFYKMDKASYVPADNV